MIGRRPITKVKSKYVFKRVKVFSIKRIHFVINSFIKENSRVLDKMIELTKRINKDGNNIYVKKGINNKFAMTVIHEISKK